MTYLWNGLTNLNDVKVYFNSAKHSISFGVGFAINEGQGPALESSLMAFGVHGSQNTANVIYLWHRFTNINAAKVYFRII